MPGKDSRYYYGYMNLILFITSLSATFHARGKQKTKILKYLNLEIVESNEGHFDMFTYLMAVTI